MNGAVNIGVFLKSSINFNAITFLGITFSEKITMNANIEKLYQLAGKQQRRIIGLMSGTSMDGLDIALCICRGSGKDTDVEVQHFITKPYQDNFRAAIKSVFSKRDADLETVAILNEHIANCHADLILEALDDWGVSPTDVDIIASHGQTIFHAPKSLHGKPNFPNATLQIGDGDHIAVKTGIITLSDFRQKHLAAGGEGAPLAVYGDYLIFSQQGEDRIMLNIGGIANFTFLPASQDASAIFSTDVGPGNTLMDQFVQLHYPGLYYDEDSKLAMSGSVNEILLNELLNNVFFDADFPKTTGPELFNLSYLQKAQKATNTANLDKIDVLATLCHFSATSIASAIAKTKTETANPTLFVSGGGLRNTLLISLIHKFLPNYAFKTTSDLGIDPDAKEAVLFAVLANETLAGNPIDFGGRAGVPSVCMGKISLPN